MAWCNVEVAVITPWSTGKCTVVEDTVRGLRLGVAAFLQSSPACGSLDPTYMPCFPLLEWNKKNKKNKKNKQKKETCTTAQKERLQDRATEREGK